MERRRTGRRGRTGCAWTLLGSAWAVLERRVQGEEREEVEGDGLAAEPTVGRVARDRHAARRAGHRRDRGGVDDAHAARSEDDAGGRQTAAGVAPEIHAGRDG